MKILLINSNPVVSKLANLSSKKISAVLVEADSINDIVIMILILH